MVYRLPSSALPLNKAENQLVSGKTRIVVSQAVLQEGNAEQEPFLLVGPTASLVVQNDDNARRELAPPNTGTNSLLIVRCSSADRSPSRSASQMTDDVFGSLIPGKSDRHNLASQMDACSGGVLQFEPAVGNSAIVNGAVDIRISQSTSGVLGSTVQNYCMEKLQDTVGQSTQWDHIFMILPNNGTSRLNIAFTLLTIICSGFWWSRGFRIRQPSDFRVQGSERFVFNPHGP